LYSDIQQLAIKAFPQANTEIRRVLGKDAFLQAMQDQECSLKIREMDVATLEDAYKHAVRLQAIYKSAKQRGETSQQFSVVRDKTTQHSDQNMFAPCNSVSINWRRCAQGSHSNLDRIGTIMIDFHVQRVFGQTANSRPSFPSNRNHMIARIQDFLGHSLGSNIPRIHDHYEYQVQCYNCGQAGHIQRHCPYNGQPAYQVQVGNMANTQGISGNAASINDGHTTQLSTANRVRNLDFQAAPLAAHVRRWND
jgi:hypothetical protein